MKFPSFSKLGTPTKRGLGKLGESEYLIPVLYFAGAAGGLAYGTYALVNHLRDDGRDGTSAGDVAKVGVPVLVGSGLAYLGVRDLRSGKPMAEEMITTERRSRVGRKGGSARRGRGRKASSKA